MKILERLLQYARLMRLHKPIPMLLLLWPTMWALWIASEGKPDLQVSGIFIAGVMLMRSAGCIMNDFADRNIDGHVERTKDRPLASQKISIYEALLLASGLSLLAFLLVLQCNALTITLAFVGAGITLIYPFLKRVTSLPQIGLGFAFSFGVPMAFAAEKNAIDIYTLCLFLTAALWPVIYDTMYAMADRKDDIKIGVKSTAILFGEKDRLIIGILQFLFVILLVMTGYIFELNFYYYLSLSLASLLFVYQQWLIKVRDPEKCIKAFLNNHWVGLIIFAGIAASYL